MENLITLKELAGELNTTPKGLRKWLRDNNIPKPGSRWEWPENHESLDLIRTLRNSTKRGRPGTKKAVKVKVEEVIVPEAKLPSKPVIVKVVGKWNIWKNEEGAIRAEFVGPNSTDKTPWYKEVEKIRPSLPKKVKSAIVENLL